MNSKQTGFSYVYTSLREEILSGQREFGSKLPSARRLSERYHIGIWTVKAVLKTLREEGLIETEERKSAVVLYKVPFAEEGNTAVRTILKRKSSILAIYETMEVLMPEILAFCSRSSSLYELEQYENAVKWARRPCPTAGSWKICSSLLHNLLDSSGNVLFSSMYAALELYAEIPFFGEYRKTLVHTTYIDNSAISWFLDCLESTNPLILRQNFTEYYHSVRSSIQTSFEKLLFLFPEEYQEEAPRFWWSGDQARYPYFRQIIGNIIEKIGVGRFLPGTYLPSEAALARQYQVSIHTIRKAMAELHSAGFVQTKNGKGTMVQKPNRHAFRYFANKKVRLLYLSALQLMALAIRPTALLVFDKLDGLVQQEIGRSFSQLHAVPLAVLTESVIQQVSLSPLKNILIETNKLMNWGIYYSFYPTGTLEGICRRALVYLRQGKRSSFADCLFACYCHVFRKIRDCFAEDGLAEAVSMKTPGWSHLI